MPTFTQIGSAVVVGSGGSATIEFTSIPSTYTDLVVKLSTRDTSIDSSPNVKMTFNGSTSGYSNRRVIGFSGTSVGSFADASIAFGIAGLDNTATHTANTFSNSEFYIPNYTSSNNKSFSMDSVIENNSSTVNALGLWAQIWANTSAITSITMTPNSGSFVQYSTAYLYGVSNA
jgi:hypothetical protein